MATLVLSAVGTAIGGPLGGTIGSLIGSQIDAALFGPPDREGPRLTELKVTTSSYGAPVGRYFGKMRAAGTIVWATELKETKEKIGGGKGQPSTTTFSYSASFAVALASRPIVSLGRIWADGNLLRGTAGDLKVGGELRLYTGSGNQRPDPLIASAEGTEASGFRGFAYCVFEELQLADFGNRIPALTFEIIADNGDVSLTELVATAGVDVSAERSLPALKGFSDEGGALAETLAAIDLLFPLSSHATDNRLIIGDGDPAGDPLLTLPDPVVDASGDSFGGSGGKAQRLRADASRIPAGLRYYDVERDFQAGLQRASGRAAPGRNRIIDFPGALQAGNAKALADHAAERANFSQERMAWRIAEIDPQLVPGQIVALPGKTGKWRVEAWEWRENGVELELQRLPQRRGAAAVASPGRSLTPVDAVATPTLLVAFELAWDGSGSPDTRRVFAAASSASAGWTGAALYAEANGGLAPFGASGAGRSIIGMTQTALAPMQAALVDRHSLLDVTLASTDFVLESRSLEDLAAGANRALVGEEILQFARAEHVGGATWRISTLLRGRGGTEHLALSGTPAGAAFVLLDDRPLLLDESQLGIASSIAAIGLADGDPVTATIVGAGTTLRPLTPVHPRVAELPDGSLALCWIRRARGAWAWPATVEVPLNEQGEAWEIGLGDPDASIMRWEVTNPALTISAAVMGQLRTDHPGEPLWVRQIGTHARSLPLFLTTIA